MSDIIPALRQHEFPACCHLALEHLGSMVAQASGKSPGGGTIPGLGVLSEEKATQIIDEFVFCVKNSRGKHVKKLSAIKELQLLESLSAFFHHQTSDVVRDTVFRLIFGGEQEEGEGDERGQIQVLCKLISMAVATSNVNIMNAAASWMQIIGCSSVVVSDMVHALVSDYCIKGNHDASSSPIRKLPALSALFACHFVSAVTTLYAPAAAHHQNKSQEKDVIPVCLLTIITDWLEADPRLYLLSLSNPASMKTTLWTSPSKSNTQTPIPGLVRWCCAKSVTNPSEPLANTDCSKQLVSELLSRLHLAVLNTVLSFPGLPGASQLELITLSDMYKIISEVRSRSQPDVDTSSLGVDRLVQVLQVALATGAFRCSLADLRAVFSAIPSNRLLAVLEKQHLSPAPPQMHNVS